MDKSSFLNFYQPLLRIHFYYDVFLQSDDINVVEQKLELKDLMDFYVLRTVKNRLLDNRRVEDREQDLESTLITLKEARQDPKNGTWIYRVESYQKTFIPYPLLPT